MQQAPRFSRIESSSAGTFLSVRALPNDLLQIEWNRNVVPSNWSLLTRGNADDTGLFNYTDRSAPGLFKRFYRVVRP